MKVIRTPHDLGDMVRAHRKAQRLKATALAERSGRARNVLYRLETGQDITVASLFDLLRAMNLTVSLEPLGQPTLEDMRRRFGDDDEEDTDAKAHGGGRSTGASDAA